MTGDFNTDFLSNRADIMSKVNIFKEIDSSYLLDVFIINLSDKVLGSYQISFTDISRHDLIGISYECPMPSTVPKIYYFRDYTGNNPVVLRNDFCLFCGTLFFI